MTRCAKCSCLLLTLLACQRLVFAQTAQTVSLEFFPASFDSKEVPPANTPIMFDLMVTNHPVLRDIVAVEVFVTFDPSFLQITDPFGNPVSRLTPSASFPNPVVNSVDNARGVIHYNAFAESSFVSAPAALVTLHVRPKGFGRGELKIERNQSQIELFSAPLDVVRPQIVTNASIVIGEREGVVIFAVQAKEISRSSARITWKTDRPATSQVFFGERSPLENKTEEDTELKTDHDVLLTGLKANTQYEYQVRSANQTGNVTLSDVLLFQTNDADRLSPSILHEPLAEGGAGSVLTAEATVRDDVAVAKVTLFHRAAGSASAPTALPMSHQGGGRYAALLTLREHDVAYYIEAVDTSGNRATDPPQAPAAAHLIRVALPTGDLAGTVRERTTAEPLPGAEVVVRETLQKASTGPDGAYRLEKLPAKTLSVKVSKVGFLVQTVPVEVLAGQTVVLDVDLEASATVAGVVTNARTGAAVEGAEVRVETDDGQSFSTTTGAGGAYLLSHFPGGTHRFVVAAVGFFVFEEERGFFAGEVATADVAVEPKPISRLVIDPSRVSIGTGGSIQFQVFGFTDDNVLIRSLENIVRYTVFPSSLGSVATGGLFTAGEVEGEGDVDAVLENGTTLPGGAIQDQRRVATARVTVRREFFFTLVSVTNPSFDPRRRGARLAEEGIILYRLSQPPLRVELRIYTLRGHHVATLSDPFPRTRGSFSWNGRDRHGRIMPPGLYVLQLYAESERGRAHSEVRVVSIWK